MISLTNKANNGYTIIELLLVITIMGILFTISYQPQLKNNFQVKQEIESLAADFRWARNKAIIDNQVYIFRIYTIKEKITSNKIPYYFYVKKGSKQIIKRKGYYSADLILYKTLKLKVVEKEYYEWIRFNNTATARGGTIGLAEAHPGSKIYSITINQLGRVKVGK